MKSIKLFIYLITTGISLLFCFSSCQKEKVCGVDNPLTDLLWLKEYISEIEKDSVTVLCNHVMIYQCTYRHGTGFMLNRLCPDVPYSFLNCEGVVLCSGGGFTGEDNCAELKISKKNKLIYHHEP
jgi:hypothetical protein